MQLYILVFKRLFDILFSLLALIALLPIMIILSIYVYIFISRNVIFSQARPGLNEKIFKMYKFRTMHDLTDENGVLMPDHQRLTYAGNILRQFSLDELPELINIIKGDMSIIGPRPLLPEYLDLYTLDQKKRHSVRPGLTGLAQVNGRNRLDWDTKLSFDSYYSENLSFLMDVKIFLKTIKQILKSNEINHHGKIMPAFKGTNKEKKNK